MKGFALSFVIVNLALQVIMFVKKGPENLIGREGDLWSSVSQVEYGQEMVGFYLVRNYERTVTKSQNRLSRFTTKSMAQQFVGLRRKRKRRQRNGWSPSHALSGEMGSVWSTEHWFHYLRSQDIMAKHTLIEKAIIH